MAVMRDALRQVSAANAAEQTRGRGAAQAPRQLRSDRQIREAVRPDPGTQQGGEDRRRSMCVCACVCAGLWSMVHLRWDNAAAYIKDGRMSSNYSTRAGAVCCILRRLLTMRAIVMRLVNVGLMS